MGRYYALNDGEPADVAAACADTTSHRASQATRRRRRAYPTAVALADKLETLAGLFGIGQTPTGDKDPFAHCVGMRWASSASLIEQN